MNNDGYISDFQLEEIQKNKCKQIESYLELREKWIACYDEFGMSYPTTSDNNFRDGCFHFRKLYKERSRDEIICQIANYEEHIQRAERDFIVKFLQDISLYIEMWYLTGLNQNKEHAEKYDSFVRKWKKESECFDEKGMIKCEWVHSLFSFCKNNNVMQEDFYVIAILIYDEYVWNNELKIILQRLLHKMKNIILKIRLNTSEIQRIAEVGLLTEKCLDIYNEIIEICNSYYIKQLIILAKDYYETFLE